MSDITFSLQAVDEVSSTNDVVKAAIKRGEPEGFAVLARRQTGGYGRQGRAWTSPAGGMYLSVLLRPQVPLEQLPTLSLVVGLAVRRALLGTVESILLKWPNDVVFGNGVPFKKLCGISLELVNGAVCVGIGVNVFPPEQAPCEEQGAPLRNQPVYLADLCRTATDGEAAQPLSTEFVCETVLQQLTLLYSAWLRDGFGPLREEYEACSALRGRSVTIEANNGSVIAEGEVAGVSDDGSLLLCGADRQLISVSSGEAHVKVVE